MLAEETFSQEVDHELNRRLAVVFVGSVLLGVALLLRVMRPAQEDVASLLAMIGAAIVALPILIDTLAAIKSTGFSATKFYMDQYIVLAVAGCFASGLYVTAGIVAVILVVGQILEERSVLGVEQAVSSLAKLSQVKARRLRDGVEEEVDAETLIVGDIIRIRPGDTVPADSRILSGESTLNQAGITGESKPVDKQTGEDVFAGTSNLTGLLEAEVVNTGQETVLGRVQSLIEEAKSSSAPIVRLAEDYARYYTPLVLLIAVAVFFFTRDLQRAISVIIVSIPCAFVLASPSAMVAALASASRFGILIKGTGFLEIGSSIDTVVFDKTGTLTHGKLEVVRAESMTGFGEDQVLSLCAAAEQHSRHPIAKAIVAAAHRRGLAISEIEALKETPGHGVQCRVGNDVIIVGRASWLEKEGVRLPEVQAPAEFSAIHLAVNGRCAGRVLLRDKLRESAAETIRRLREGGVRDFVMLTGDRTEVAQSIANEVGLTNVRAECLPEDKLEAVEALKKEKRRVMVVGDGVNDAPALAAGNLGVAMGALGNEVAIHTADVALMSDDLRRLPALVNLSRRTVNIINQNLLCGFLFIAIAITISTMGFISPVMAAFIHEFSAFFVIFNSARLLRFDEDYLA